jgi:hypothetical protein
MGHCKHSVLLEVTHTFAQVSSCEGLCLDSALQSDVLAGGLAVLVEKKSRRMELALYCLSRAAESFSRYVFQVLVYSESHLPGPDRSTGAGLTRAYHICIQ